MKIEQHKIKVRDVFDGYRDNDEEGVVGYHGKLNIRPKYQREFIYKDAQERAVIDTVRKGFPLNVMYWMKRTDGGFEMLDGQQRTLSLCHYISGNFFCQWDNDMLGFRNLLDSQQNLIMDYELIIYICEGTDKERLDWFRIINIASEQLTDQEIRNAVYSGPWVEDAKRHFSKSNCVAYNLAKDYMTGSHIRQAYLETAIDWMSQGHIEQYMGIHQNDPDASELWGYFVGVFTWVKAKFPKYHCTMKGAPWGELYNAYHDTMYDPAALEAARAKLLMDDDVTNKKGIYTYLFTHDEKHLSIRAFSPQQRIEAYERQRGKCKMCEKHFEIDEMEADHITPWSQGGKTIPRNCQMLCRECNRRKSDI